MARYIAQTQQKYTQSGGMRPFGISTLIVGYEVDGEPRLFQTDPSGTYSEWKANAIGRNSKTVREYLEKHYDERQADPARLAVEALLEVVESGRSIEIAVVRRNEPLRFLSDDDVAALITSVEAERAEAEAAAKAKAGEK